jgi:hypothetical protein
VGPNRTAKAVLVRLDANGSIQWARKVHVPLSSFYGDTPNATGLIPKAGDKFLVTSPDYEIDESFNFLAILNLVQFDANGTLQWGRRFENASLGSGISRIDNQGTIVLGFDHTSPALNTVTCILNDAGAVVSLVQVEGPAPGFFFPVAASIAAGKIYYSGYYQTSPLDILQHALIGASSLTLSGFTASEYTPRQFHSSFLTPLEDGRLAFIGEQVDTGQNDFVLLDSNLQAQAGCPLFQPVNLTISTPDFTNSALSLTASDISVQSASLAFTNVPVDLVFELYSFMETSLCNIVASPSLNISLSLAEVVLSWPTSASGFVLECVTNLSATNWVSNSPQPVIVGPNYVVTNATPAGAKFYRLRK